MSTNEDTGITKTIPFGFIGVEEPLFSQELQVSALKKQLMIPPRGSAQWRPVGKVQHPINYENAIKLMLSVDIQQTCIQTKRDATVGLGFETEEDQLARDRKKELDQQAQDVAMGRVQTPSKPPTTPANKADGEGTPPGVPPSDGDPKASGSKKPQMTKSKVETALDPLCDAGFQSLMNQCGEDFENTGMAYLEVVRESDDPKSKIVSLWHMPASLVFVVNESKKPNYHFQVADGNRNLRYVRFGDLERFKQDNPNVKQPEGLTELIRIRLPNSIDPHYSFPSWISVVPWLELAQMLLQYHFDFFQNRAVPSLLVLLTGGKVTDKEMTDLQMQLKETVGPGKRFRSLLAALQNPNIQAHIERLASESNDTFESLWSAVQLKIVSSHRIPPLLAGVTLPGKMAASNELPNALIAFQTLYIGPNQRLFEYALGSTLGSEDAGLGLQPSDFRLKKITDFYDMGQVDTMSRMRETATEAQLSGRKLQDGLKE